MNEKSKEFAATRRYRRRLYRKYAWTSGDVYCVGTCSKEWLRAVGAKLGAQILGCKPCVLLSHDRFDGLRPALYGAYHLREGYVHFFKIYFVPHRKAGKIAKRLLKFRGVRTAKLRRRFKSCPTDIDFIIAPVGHVYFVEPTTSVERLGNEKD